VHRQWEAHQGLEIGFCRDRGKEQAHAALTAYSVLYLPCTAYWHTLLSRCQPGRDQLWHPHAPNGADRQARVGAPAQCREGGAVNAYSWYRYGVQATSWKRSNFGVRTSVQTQHHGAESDHSEIETCKMVACTEYSVRNTTTTGAGGGPWREIHRHQFANFYCEKHCSLVASLLMSSTIWPRC
jgi:hypothetical protein